MLVATRGLIPAEIVISITMERR